MANTHLGVPVGDIVLLQWSGSGVFTTGPVRILPDGDRINDFAIPARRYLVITDIEWHVNTAFDYTGASVDVFFRSKSPTNFVSFPYQARVFVEKGFGYLSDHLTSPLVVHPSVKFDLLGPGPTLVPESILAEGVTVNLRGYLLRA